MKSTYLAATAIAASLAVTGPMLGGAALAQTAQSAAQPAPSSTQVPPAEAAPEGPQLEEIVVTAQKRSENLQSVPISVSAITATAAMAAGIRSSQDLSFAVPGLNITRTTQATNFTLRGIGTQGGSTGQDSANALFVDGVYQPSMSGSTLALNNIERVEVLKGPQGTLYGRNATGGAINIITRDPSHDASFQGEMGYGNLRTVFGQLYATAPVSDTIAVDVAAYYNDQGKGFGRNTFLNRDINKQRDFAVRSKLIFTPTDDLKITLSGDYSYTNSSYATSYRPVPTSALLDGSRGYTGGYYDSRSEFVGTYHTRIMGTFGRIDYTMGDFKLSSLTAYRYLTGFQRVEVDATPIKVIDAPIYSQDGQFTEEVQLGYSSGKLNAIVGLFYMDAYDQYNPFQIVSNVLFGPLPGRQQIISRQDTKSYAAFAQATYELFTDTNLTLGARYTRDERRLNATQFIDIANGLAIIPLPTIKQGQNYRKPTWRIALDHKFTPELMVYGSFSRGFKSGLYNLTAPADPAVKEEVLDAYELGFKSDLLDRRLRLNVAGFYYEYSNIQLFQVNGANTTLSNAAKAEVYGIDFDVSAAVTSNLTFNAGLEYLHDEYKKFVLPGVPVSTVNPTGPGNIVVSGTPNGNRLANVPDWTANGSINYRIPLGNDSKIDANLSANYNDGFYWAADNRVRQPSYILVNSQIMWTAPGGQWNIRLFGKNITKRKYLVAFNENGTGDIGAPAPGRTYGAAVGVKF